MHRAPAHPLTLQPSTTRAPSDAATATFPAAAAAAAGLSVAFRGDIDRSAGSAPPCLDRPASPAIVFPANRGRRRCAEVWFGPQQARVAHPGKLVADRLCYVNPLVSGAARGGEASPLWVDVQKLCVLSLSWNFFVSLIVINCNYRQPDVI